MFLDRRVIIQICRMANPGWTVCFMAQMLLSNFVYVPDCMTDSGEQRVPS